MAKPDKIPNFQEMIEQELYKSVHTKGQRKTTTEWAMNLQMEIIVKLLVKMSERLSHIPIEELVKDLDEAITDIERKMIEEEGNDR